MKVDVWNYKDARLQSSQLLEGTIYVPPSRIEIPAVVNIIENKINCLGEGEEKMEYYKSNFGIVANDQRSTDMWWKTYSKSPYLVSFKDGSRKVIDMGNNYPYGIAYSFSADGRYMVYFNPHNKSYWSCNLASGKMINITKAILTCLHRKSDRDSLAGAFSFPIGIGGWMADDDDVLIYDEYDIWQVDVNGVKPPVNFTNGYGQANRIKFRLVNSEASTYSSKKTILLTAFNTITKYNGFYQKKLTQKGNPELLSMGPLHVFTQPEQASVSCSINMPPLKAKDVDKWIVMPHSPNEAPNYHVTTDFKNYKRLTDIQPQKSYNWLTTELVSWKQLDGSTSQGILYKPENFNPNNKYPLIFTYYEAGLSDQLFEYRSPWFTGGGNIDISWFVSRGYLVFTPDIYYTVGKAGKGVCNSVVSAAQYLSKKPWVDGAKMAIGGQSYGGYETNFLVTHSNIFAAAVSSAGISDCVSHYGQLLGQWYGGTIGHGMYEMGQMRIPVTLWENPNLYIENSPIFKVNEVTTPILIRHNKGDDNVPWMQSVEFFCRS